MSFAGEMKIKTSEPTRASLSTHVVAENNTSSTKYLDETYSS